MARRLLALVPAIVLLAASAPALAQTNPCASGARLGSYSLVLQSGGIKRYVRVHVPAKSRPGQPLPLVLVLHGAGGTGRRMEQSTGLDATADRYGFVAVYPSAAWKLWNIT